MIKLSEHQSPSQNQRKSQFRRFGLSEEEIGEVEGSFCFLKFQWENFSLLKKHYPKKLKNRNRYKMMQTDEEKLLHAACIIRDWDSNGTIIEIEHAFLIADEVPRGQYPEAWQEFRKAITGHEVLNLPFMKEQIGIPKYAEEGRWWWDPKKW